MENVLYNFLDKLICRFRKKTVQLKSRRKNATYTIYFNITVGNLEKLDYYCKLIFTPPDLSGGEFTKTKARNLKHMTHTSY